jgi:Cof subfamily protein (haloacid dehalogenase superfamily)
MKLIASDLDGTLLDENGEVSTENVQAIKRAMDMGIQFITATGRSYDAALKPLEAAGISCPIICLNGANAYTSDKKLLLHIPMDIAVTKEIRRLCEQEGIYIEYFTNKGIFSTSRDYFVAVMVDVLRSAHPDMSEEALHETAAQRLQEEKATFVRNYDELYNMDNLEIYKILGFALDKEKLQRVHERLLSKDTLAITSSGDINLEFNHHDAQKGLTLQKIAADMGIGMQDVMALGDNFNDASMLTMAGRGVAMANAEDEIKAMCNYTTAANDEHGVARAIEEMLKEAIV